VPEIIVDAVLLSSPIGTQAFASKTLKTWNSTTPDLLCLVSQYLSQSFCNTSPSLPWKTDQRVLFPWVHVRLSSTLPLELITDFFLYRQAKFILPQDEKFRMLFVSIKLNLRSIWFSFRHDKGLKNFHKNVKRLKHTAPLGQFSWLCRETRLQSAILLYLASYIMK
jgi:hypothetical protein